MVLDKGAAASLSAKEYAFVSASGIAERVSKRIVSPIETVEAALDAAATTEPALHAFATLASDQARADARALEARLARGERVGPLAGVPVAIKDLVLTKGLRTTFGSHLYADYIPEQDDVVVERLKAAGALVIGKTNVAEFGYGAFGHNRLFPTTRNPWNTDLTPGGSRSAGSAAAVAAGVCPLAIGSDGGGSVRLPSAFTALVGIKASMGRVPLWPGCRDPGLPGASGWESIEHIGPMARYVADAALMLQVMAGPDARDRWSLPDDKMDFRAAALPRDRLSFRVGYCPDWQHIPIDPVVRAAIDQAAASFEELGCSVETIATPLDDIMPTFRAIVALETDITGLRRLAKGREDLLIPSVRELLRHSWTADKFCDALTERKRIVETLRRLMERFDLLLTPTAPLLPFAIDRDGPGTIAGEQVADDMWTPALIPFNLTGQPAMSVPAGFSPDGLPIGLQIVGRHLHDAEVIAAAATFEAASSYGGRRPPISALMEAAR